MAYALERVDCDDYQNDNHLIDMVTQPRVGSWWESLMGPQWTTAEKRNFEAFWKEL